MTAIDVSDLLQFSTTWFCSDNLDYANLFETRFPSASSVSLAWIKFRLLIDSYECVYACDIYYWVSVSWKKKKKTLKRDILRRIKIRHV